jgi:hypothetical protein
VGPKFQSARGRAGPSVETTALIRESTAFDESHRNLRRQAGVGDQQRAIGPEAATIGRLPDRVEQEWRERLAGDASGHGFLKRVIKSGF